eukprot:9466996-Pyramimonas_sp.AAC.1
MMFQPTLALITRKKCQHQDTTETGGCSRAGPWEATLVQHGFGSADAGLAGLLLRVLLRLAGSTGCRFEPLRGALGVHEEQLQAVCFITFV